MDAAAILQIIQNKEEGALRRHLDSVINFARQIPAYSGNILEWHLNRDHAPFDFACRINADYDKPLLLVKPMQPDTSPFIQEGYSGLLDSNNNCFKFGIQNIWLEYDFPFPGNPALFFDIHRKAATSPLLKWEHLKLICGYFQQALPPAAFDFLNKIHASHLIVVYAGFMFSRESQSLRLTIKGMEPGQLPEILKLLTWPGDYQAVAKLLGDYTLPGQTVMLSVDFDDQLRQRIGVEFFAPDFVLFTQKLRQNNVIREDQLRLLAQWEGKLDLPPAAAKALTQVHQRIVNHIYKRINHFKFIIQEHTVTAKAYLYYCF